MVAAIAVGGALGAPSRHAVAELLPHSWPTDSFPWATFVVNVMGGLLLGFVLVVLLERFPPTRYVRPFVATGFLGTFTTYSAFALETVQLIEDGRPGLGAAYAAGTVLAGLVAVWVGVQAANRVPLRPLSA